MKFARVCLNGSWLAFGRHHLGATEMLLPVFPCHAHLQETRRPCRVWVEDQPARGRFLFSFKCGKEWTSRRILFSTDRWKSTAKNQDNVVWIVSLGLREYKKLRRICSELLPMVRQLVQEVNWHEAMVEDKGSSVEDILKFHPVALKWDSQGVCLYCYEPGGQKQHTAIVTPDVNEGVLEMTWTSKMAQRPQQQRQVVDDISQAVMLLREMANKATEKPMAEALWKSRTQDQVDLPPERHPHVGSILDLLAPGEGLERNLEGLSKMLATMKGGTFPQEDSENKLVPTTVWLDHGALKRLVYQMANFHHASDERIYSRALQALVRLLKAGRDVASADFIKAVILAISGEGLNHIGVYRMLAALINRPEVKQAAMDMCLPHVLLTELQRYCVMLIPRKNSSGMVTTRSGRYSARTTAAACSLGGVPPTAPLARHLVPGEGHYSLVERFWGVHPCISTNQVLYHLQASVLEILLALSPLQIPDCAFPDMDFPHTLVKHLLLMWASKNSLDWRKSVRTYDLAIACVHEYTCGTPRGLSVTGREGLTLFLPRSKPSLTEAAERDLLVGYIGPEVVELVGMHSLDVTVQKALYDRLRLLVDYIWSSPSPFLAQELVECVARPLSELSSMILRGAVARSGDWPVTLLQLFYLVLSLFTALMERIGGQPAQIVLLSAVAGGGDFMDLVWQYAWYTLTCVQIRDVLGDSQLEVMGVCAWRFLSALAELCKDQEPQGSEDSVVVELSRQMAFALEPESGLVVRILGMVHWLDEDAFRDLLCTEVLAFLEGLVRIPNSILLMNPSLLACHLELNFRSFLGHLAHSKNDLRCTPCSVCCGHLKVVQAILSMHTDEMYASAVHLQIGEQLMQEIIPQMAVQGPAGSAGCSLQSQTGSRSAPFTRELKASPFSAGDSHISSGQLTSISSHPVEFSDVDSLLSESSGLEAGPLEEPGWPVTPDVEDDLEVPRSHSPCGSGRTLSRAATTTSSLRSWDSIEFEGKQLLVPRPPGVPMLDLALVLPSDSEGDLTPATDSEEKDLNTPSSEADDDELDEEGCSRTCEGAEHMEPPGGSESDSDMIGEVIVPVNVAKPHPGHQGLEAPLLPVMAEDDGPPLALMPIPECKQMMGWKESGGLGTSPRSQPPSGLEFTGDCSEDARRWEEWEGGHNEMRSSTSSDCELSECSEPVGFSNVPETTNMNSRTGKAHPAVPPVALNMIGSVSFDKVACKGTGEVAHHLIGIGVAESRPENGRIVWKHKSLHAGVLRVLLEYVLLEFRALGDRHGGESLLVQQLCVALHQHLNKLHNRVLLMELRDWAVLQGPHYIRLLRLLVKELLDESLFPSLGRIGRGQFAQIHRCGQPIEGGPATCAVKVVDVPEDPHAMRSLRDIYKEIEMLEHLAHLPCVCELYDYGVAEDTIFIVMRDYKCDLLAWRRRIPNTAAPSMTRLFLKIFLQVAEAVQTIHEDDVVHFDLKCSNIFLEALPGFAEGDNFWVTQIDEPPFRVVVGDFGEAMLIGDEYEPTLRSRGTEFMKSPEMLLIGKENPSAEFAGAPGRASDVWALGCLLFELYTGQLLFDDANWGEFFARITNSSAPLVPEEKLGMLPRGSKTIVTTLLRFVLIRDPRLRPPLPAVIAWVRSMLECSCPPHHSMYHETLARPDPSTSALSCCSSMNTTTRRAKSREGFVPLTKSILLCSWRSMEDPWALLLKRISHILYINSGNAPDEMMMVKSAACRAEIPLVTVGVRDSVDDTWGDSVTSMMRMVKSGRKLAVVLGSETGSPQRDMLERISSVLMSEEMGWPEMKCRLSVRTVMVQ